MSQDKTIKKGAVNLNLVAKLENAFSQYVKLFEEKHDLGFEFWIGNRTGGTACFSGHYYVNFDDLRLDLENNVPVELFYEWYDLIGTPTEDEPNINYYSFLKAKSII